MCYHIKIFSFSILFKYPKCFFAILLSWYDNFWMISVYMAECTFFLSLFYFFFFWEGGGGEVYFISYML